MNTIGIDIGSLNTKVVVLGEKDILASLVVPSGDDVATTTDTALKAIFNLIGTSVNGHSTVVTGIGSKSLLHLPQTKSITSCLARGIYYLFPTVHLAIDMGAESTTVIKINQRGRLADWANHDKCASGTGLFLQQMANLMQMPLGEMAQFSLQAQGRADITSTCAVFAESEVISHVHRIPPTPKSDIVAGIYYSVVSRVISLCKRIGIEKEVAATGGVALNTGLITILEKELGLPLQKPDKPQIVAALGAAIIARENAEKGLK